jgi:KRAB domain-containing zinc finger protein
MSTTLRYQKYRCAHNRPKSTRHPTGDENTHLTLFKCSVCSLNFANADHLDKHMNGRHGALDLSERPYECPEIGCHKAYATEARLVIHVRRVHEGFKGDHICATCSKPFYTAQALIIHERTHTGDRPFTCAECAATFTSKSDYRVHMRRTHMKIKPFKCEHCGDLFSTGVELHKHMDVHRDGRLYACVVCTRRFSSASSRNKHQIKCTG